MNHNPPRPQPKCPPHATDRPDRAATASPPMPGCGRERVARQGVLSALPPDQQPSIPPQVDGRFPVAWLHIRAPRGATPTATSKCLCGRDRSAIGRARVLSLIDDHTAHRDTCPLRSSQEGRTAA